MRNVMMVPAIVLILATGCDRAPREEAATTGDAPAAAGPAESPANWRLSADAYGPVRIGMSKEAIKSLVPGSFDVAAPAEPGGCGYATWDSVPRGVRLMFAGDTLVRVESDSAGIETALGARVGNSAARVDSLHGPQLRRMPHKYTAGLYLIAITPLPADTLHRIVFETDSAMGKVTRMRAGRLPQVEWVEGCS